VVDAAGLEPGHRADLAEPASALVQVEQVGDAAVIGREAGRRGWDHRVPVGVARDEDVEQAVAVDVGHRRPRVPAEGPHPRAPGALGERPVALVPEHGVVGVAAGVVAGGRDEEVGRAVAVEVRGCAPAAADAEARARRGRDVLEAVAEVAVEAARR
jgi:hypothetical protein